jgi:hypothetical protein
VLLSNLEEQAAHIVRGIPQQEQLARGRAGDKTPSPRQE